MTWRTALGLKPSFFVDRAIRTSMYSPGIGESGARARLAFRTLAEAAVESVATSCSKAASCDGSP
jgi:hypothetical protein